MLELFAQVQKAFPAAGQPHYQFTLRDLSAWVEGLVRCAESAAGLSSSLLRLL
jgi:hypothetical protein